MAFSLPRCPSPQRFSSWEGKARFGITEINVVDAGSRPDGPYFQ
jgi:hypothetical protein